jgi:predicted alpha/beta hydrolase family esterase
VPTILFIQGAGEGVHDQWDHRLVASLETHLGTAVRYPRLPDEANPTFAAWGKALRAALGDLTDGDVLVGHSVGGAMLLRVLAEGIGLRPGALVTIAAPFVGPGGWTLDDMPAISDLGGKLPRGMPVFLHHGTADDEVPPDHARLYARAIPQAVLRLHHGCDHQLNDDLRPVADDIRPLIAGG